MDRRAVRVVISVILVINLLEFCECLKLGDKGVCEKFIPNIVVCLDKKGCKDKVIAEHNSSGKGKTPGKKKLICCKNFEFDIVSKKCSPLCRSGCLNGICVDVDKCHCEPPLILMNNTCIQPTCTSCEHGDCVAPEDCRCHKGYLKLNGTCTPHCSFVCSNGVCAEPNKCICNSGYSPDPVDESKCNPICDPKCVNGDCVAHNKCICSAGYKRFNDSVCEPDCASCEYGQCVEPNNCICFDGYERMNSTCKPKCSSCSNGECIAPGNCSCHDGYHLTEAGCMPSCSTPCDNGRCVAPGNCSCNDGYTLTDKGCKPVCTIPCVNGRCTAPNFCTCDAGYRKNDTNHSLCHKPCYPECSNGTCDLNGQCTCYDDFQLDEETRKCTTVKPIDCATCNGTCPVDGGEPCRCANKTLCFAVSPDLPPEVSPSTKMASMDLKLISIGGACLLLLIVIVVVMQRIWHKRNEYGSNKPTNENSGVGSVAYTVPHTLIMPRTSAEFDDNEECCDESPNTDNLLRRNELH